MIDKNTYTKQLIIKPSSLCNFSCNFCSTRKLNIPQHDKVPQVLKDFIKEFKPNDLIVTGGEPLTNPRSYFEDLFELMDSLNIEYEMSLTSNMVLWYENPEKYDYLINNPHVSIDTSFQYGIDRHDGTVYTDDRFRKVCQAFKERYNKSLWFIYVVNEANAQYVRKACKLAKELDTCVKFNSQFPVGAATKYYPKYKLLDILLQLLDEGIIDPEHIAVNALTDKGLDYVLSNKNLVSIKINDISNLDIEKVSKLYPYLSIYAKS